MIELFLIRSSKSIPSLFRVIRVEKPRLCKILTSCSVIIDPTRISFYNTFMVSLRCYFAGMFSYCAGFFRPDHDPPAPALRRVH
jgi:hypothetical protein